MRNDRPENGSRREEPACYIWITHIKFNYDESSLSNDAFNIRIDQLHDVPVPEWDQSKFRPEESPAAYAIKETAGHTVYIQCRFEMDPASAAATATVKATGGGILGAIDPITVNFVNGVSHDASHPGNQEYVQIPLRHRKFSAITREDISWEWLYKCPHSHVWHPMDIRTHHRIYVVLEQPPLPWSQTDAQRYPWTSALDYAIVSANTRGLSDAREAAARVVQHVNGEPLQYDIWGGRPFYYAGGFGGGTFMIAAWLAGFINGPIVNCYDCASAVTTFSNVLGCHLTYQFHGPFGYLDPVYPIGRGLCNNPFYGLRAAPYNVPLVGVDDAGRTSFGNHAYSKQAGNNYDACMRGAPGCATALAYYILGLLILILSLGAAATLAHLLFMRAAGFLVDLSQPDYESITLDTSTPAEALRDGGAPVPEALSI
ncbi:MAG TPA: hypothetical protein VFN26_02550 [Candidatus Acidoferrum sp.]|nr:hypothetical protein [Candidatus Acidoferrum sp.]